MADQADGGQSDDRRRGAEAPEPERSAFSLRLAEHRDKLPQFKATADKALGVLRRIRALERSAHVWTHWEVLPMVDLQHVKAANHTAGLKPAKDFPSELLVAQGLDFNEIACSMLELLFSTALLAKICFIDEDGLGRDSVLEFPLYAFCYVYGVVKNALQACCLKCGVDFPEASDYNLDLSQAIERVSARAKLRLSEEAAAQVPPAHDE